MRIRAREQRTALSFLPAITSSAISRQARSNC